MKVVLKVQMELLLVDWMDWDLLKVSRDVLDGFVL